MMLFRGRLWGQCSWQPRAGKRLQKQGLAVQASHFSKIQVPSLWDNHNTLQKSSGKYIRPALLHPACSVAFSDPLHFSSLRPRFIPKSPAVPRWMQMLWDPMG